MQPSAFASWLVGCAVRFMAWRKTDGRDSGLWTALCQLYTCLPLPTFPSAPTCQRFAGALVLDSLILVGWFGWFGWLSGSLFVASQPANPTAGSVPASVASLPAAAALHRAG